MTNTTIADITNRIVERSRDSRATYLEGVEAVKGRKPGRGRMGCANHAHAFAAMPDGDKFKMMMEGIPNLGIVTAYNDMLSAHQPYGRFPDVIKAAAREVGATAQVAGGVPAMCDGVTQGMPGMELSLFSRDVIAMSTAVALSHDAFEAALYLGVCDKIVPGLVMGALAYGHLPGIFVPAGPMSSGLPNKEKARIRNLYAEGKVGRDELLKSEMASYHGVGTCTFYGTANSNQMLMEFMGLHLPGSAFVHPSSALRDALTAAAAKRAVDISMGKNAYTPIADVLTEKALVNGLVGLMATGGSTNHALHLAAIGRAAGIIVTLDDFDAISRATPLLARVYPNGSSDVNHFHAAGGLAFIIRELLKVGGLNADVETIAGSGLHRYADEPFLSDEGLAWRPGTETSLDTDIVRPIDNPFDHEGGLKLVQGNIGRAVMKVSAVAPEHRAVTAPAAVFESQEAFQAAFKAGELDRDFIAVLRYQGPRANGMPELHSLTPALSVLQDRGRKVALVTDGRMSGASGKVPAAIHLSPEACADGPIARIQNGDIIRLDANAGLLEVQVAADVFAARTPSPRPAPETGYGRELFAHMRLNVTSAEAGASFLQ